MSLFGDSPPRAAQTESSLFAAETPPKTGSNAGGLFADSTSVPSDSPWDFPTPKKAARRHLIKSLLPDAIVPRQYIIYVDAILQSAGSSHPSQHVPIQVCTDLLKTTRLSSENQAKILALVAGGLEALTRSELNVVLALLALAQTGQEFTLDAVDEHKQDLPIPSLPTLDAITTSTDRPKMSGSFDADPWSSPALHKGHLHQAQNGPSSSSSNNAAATQPHRTTSSFTTNTMGSPRPEPSASSYDTVNRSSSATGVNAIGWTPDDTFAGAADHNGFTEPINDSTTQAKPVKTPRPTTHRGGAVEEEITVTALEGKEGMFMFQHRNYEVASIRRNSRVVRRYSDFVWLLDCLHKICPFRQLPLLPPKRVAINGKHIAADHHFIEKRRRGLVRFANALVRHPVLGQEQLVVMFLTVPTELSVWRKQATISAQEEFAGKTLPAGLEDSLPPTLNDTFDSVRAGVRRSAELYITVCALVEKLTKYNAVLTGEYTRLSSCLESLTEVSGQVYAIDTNDVPLLNEGLKANARHLSANASLLDDEGRAWDTGFLEDLKRQRDCLVSVRDMFDRRDRYIKDNIPQLERKILANENKISAIRAKPDGQTKPGEAAKVEDAIVKDKQSIVDQHARGVFVRECIRDELVYFNNSQYHISRLHQDWGQERVKYAEIAADNWRRLSEEIEAMPMGD